MLVISEQRDLWAARPDLEKKSRGRTSNMSESRNLLEPTEEQIRERAYKIYLAGGSEDGHDLSDWLTAERQLKELNIYRPVVAEKGAVSRRG
jgi:hypothetical protein